MNRFYSVILLVLLTGFSTRSDRAEDFSVKIINNSTLHIYGTTNVNTFNCVLNFENVNSIVQTSYTLRNNRLFFENTELKLDNSCFDCGNNMMNKDFLEMLDSDNHPYITFQLKEVVVNPKQKDEIYAFASITLAGKTKLYSIPLTLKKIESIKAVGCLSIKLTDFELEPPKKVLGLIVVNDEIDINFDLNVQALR